MIETELSPLLLLPWWLDVLRKTNKTNSVWVNWTLGWQRRLKYIGLFRLRLNKRDKSLSICNISLSNLVVGAGSQWFPKLKP